MTEPREPAFRDGMPWWAHAVLVATRIASLVPFVLAIALAVWLARGGTRQLPGMAQHVWQWVRSVADSTLRN